MVSDDESLLSGLSDHKIEFVLVGAMAAIIRGAPFTTLDVDIVHHRSPENLQRLHAWLLSIDAHFRGRPASQRLTPTLNHLDTPGHVLLRTALGPLDILGAIEGGADYDWLVARSTSVTVFNRTLLVPTMETLIELKRQGTRPEDPLKLLQLEATLAAGKSRS